MYPMRSAACLAAVVLVVALSSPLGGQTADVEIVSSHNSEGEQSSAARLRNLLAQFDLRPWLFTRRVLIDEKVIPHSHPVLTVGYADRGDDDLLLSSFVHEQLHWWFVAHPQQTDAAIAELRQLFPSLPVGGLDGAVNEQSSYLHLLVIYLEYQADKALLGEKKAGDVMAFLKGDHYRVLYKTVINSQEIVGGVVARHQLTCCPSR
jgi:hypothetical protein